MSDRPVHDDPAPLPPEPPQEGECCEDGCGEACVWAHYNEARAEYARTLAEWQARHVREPAG
ncbi:oxidoreductase-like domain-containing protein [Azotobacter beijerinckii]|uniref:oxidoreductase-like domain-containing protein n=1 Tax=Azotobacter beijerinckii TaxID=170623 RepID=UPI002954C946|nr:oxidoreductase-like domain-containing protein [Azotobacter beijerinckii]MDV7212475.1 oxidoreductase-like domain-containing protein [Azotobacter beijerinckii]